MTGRRSIGALLHRAVCGVGLECSHSTNESLRSFCIARTNGDGCHDALNGNQTGDRRPTQQSAPSPVPRPSSVPLPGVQVLVRRSAGLTPSIAFAASFTTAATAAAPPDSTSQSTSVPPSPSPSPPPFTASPAPDPALLALRSQLSDSLAVCLGLGQLDALLARPENREALDEMLLLTALDTAYRLCSSTSSTPSPPPTTLAASAASVAPAPKAPSAAASDVLTVLSELLIRLLSEPGALSPEGAVRAIRTLAALKFNPGGDYAGLMTIANFYRDAVLPRLDPSGLPLEAVGRVAPLLVDLMFAFARLFDVAARLEREQQQALMVASLQSAEAQERRAADEEGSAGWPASSSSGGVGTTPPSDAHSDAPALSVPPWQLPAHGVVESGLVVVGDRQLYGQLAGLLAGPGVLGRVTSRALGTLATAFATARFAHYPLAMSLATQTALRLQRGGVEGEAAAAAGTRGEGPPAGSTAIEPSTLSNILSCLSKIGFEHEALCDTAAAWMVQRMTRTGAGAGTGAGGLKDRGGIGGGAWGEVVSGGGGVRGLEPHHIVDIAVAFSRIKYDNADFFLRAADVLQLKLPQASANSVAMMTWALANSKSGLSPEFRPLLDALSQRMLAVYRHTALRGPSAPTPRGTVSGGGALRVVPRHLACMVFAMARLGIVQPGLMDVVAADVVAQAENYQARQLVNILHAFTALGSYRPPLYSAAAAVLTARLAATSAFRAEDLAVAPPPVPYVLGPQNYADLAWAVAAAGHASECPKMMEMLASRVSEVAPRLGKACLVRAAQAFSLVAAEEGAYGTVFDAIAQAARPQLVDLGPGYLAALVEAFSEVQHPVSEDFWMGCMDAVGLKLPHMERPRPDMQAAAVRLAAAFRRHPATEAHAACRAHYALPMLEALAPQEQINMA